MSADQQYAYLSSFARAFFYSWSECDVDNTDDGYVGDNRDGDEQWYQYRTQDFCANAAFSLYGAKKGSLSLGACQRGHFINSFFTYGGADRLLKAAGITPRVYYYGNGGNNEQNKGNDDYFNNGTSTNAACVEVDNPNYYEEQEGEQEEDQEHRAVQEGDNDGNGYVSTLGCDADGKYVIAGFEANTCDGNYFSDELDTFRAYNRQHSRIGCHRIWSSGFRHGNRYAVEYLLNHSWSCDMELYPNGCPDPYKTKERWSYAIQTLANGGNAEFAYRNMMYKTPLRIVGSLMVAIGSVVFVLGYWIKNKQRILAKGAKTRSQKAVGYLACVWEDIGEAALGVKEGIKKRIRARREKLRRRRERRKRRKEVKRRNKKSKKRSSGDYQEEPEMQDPEVSMTDGQGDDYDHYDRYDSRVV